MLSLITSAGAPPWAATEYVRRAVWCPTRLVERPKRDQRVPGRRRGSAPGIRAGAGRDGWRPAGGLWLLIRSALR